MKQWKRASLEIPCGAEWGCRIRPSEPYLELSGVSGWRKVRCGKHAGEAIPEHIDDAPVIAAAVPRPPGFTALRELRPTLDVRKKASNDVD